MMTRTTNVCKRSQHKLRDDARQRCSLHISRGSVQVADVDILHPTKDTVLLHHTGSKLTALNERDIKRPRSVLYAVKARLVSTRNLCS